MIYNVPYCKNVILAYITMHLSQLKECPHVIVLLMHDTYST
jgi:hypothetical protein